MFANVCDWLRVRFASVDSTRRSVVQSASDRLAADWSTLRRAAGALDSESHWMPRQLCAALVRLSRRRIADVFFGFFVRLFHAFYTYVVGNIRTVDLSGKRASKCRHFAINSVKSYLISKIRSSPSGKVIILIIIIINWFLKNHKLVTSRALVSVNSSQGHQPLTFLSTSAQSFTINANLVGIYILIINCSKFTQTSLLYLHA